MSKHPKKGSISPEILREALKGSFQKLNPRYMMKNPVMFVVEIGFFVTLLLSVFPGLFGGSHAGLRSYNIIISVILFVTVLFANFAESIAEGRGKAQAASLKKTQKDTEAHVLKEDGTTVTISSSELQSRPAKSSQVTVKSSKVLLRWMNPPSPANPLRSFGKTAATSAPLPAAQRLCPTG